jgi:hypothetical protein
MDFDSIPSVYQRSNRVHKTEDRTRPLIGYGSTANRPGRVTTPSRVRIQQ